MFMVNGQRIHQCIAMYPDFQFPATVSRVNEFNDRVIEDPFTCAVKVKEYEYGIITQRQSGKIQCISCTRAKDHCKHTNFFRQTITGEYFDVPEFEPIQTELPR